MPETPTGRPTLISMMPIREQILAANMYLRNEKWDDIFKYISTLNDTPAAQTSVKQLADQLEQPWSDAMYLAQMELVKTELIMDVAREKAELGDPRQMTEYQKLGTHKIRLVKQIDELQEKEETRGNTWEPTFDESSPEYRVFKACVLAFLTQETDETNDFDELSPENKARFFQILAEGA